MKSTTRFHNNKKGLECQNCGRPLGGKENFCPECGQVNDLRRLSIKDYLSGFFANFFSFDSRLYRTIVPLLFKPGKVSKEYIEGKRKKYANPFQLLLHTVLVYFLILGLFNSVERYRDLGNKSKNFNFQNDTTQVDYIDKFNTKKNHKFPFKIQYEQKLDSIFKEKDYVVFFNNDSIPKNKKDSILAVWQGIGIHLLNKNFDPNNMNINNKEFFDLSDDILKTSEVLQNYLQEKSIHYNLKDILFGTVGDALGKKTHLTGFFNRFSKFRKFSKKNKDLSEIEGLDSLKIPTNKINVFLYQKAKESNEIFKDKKSLKKFWNSILSKITIALFFLLPLFTLFFSLVYLRHPYRYSEHLVVVFNIQTAFFIVLLVSMLLDKLFDTDFFSGILQISFVVYIYKSLRRVYEQVRIKTFLKLIFLIVVYNILVFIGFVIISFLAFLL